MDNNKRKKVLTGVIIATLLVAVVGVTYALWSYFQIGKNQQLVAGEIYMKYTETSNTINIQDAMPSKTYGDDYFQFTIEGKNTYTKPIWYEIVINWGEEPEGRSIRIPDEFLRFRLTEQLPGEEEQEVIANGKYSDFSKGKKIWVNKIDAKSAETTITYKLYMWISDEMVLGSGDAAASSDMDMETWNNDAFASVKVTVNGDFTPKELEKELEPVEPVLAVKKIKDTLGQEGGVIGVTEDGEKTESLVSNIREYRYSGLNVNNYVYFNCEDDMEQNADNCEKWRVLGVFKDENDKEYVKILRNESLSGFPETYKVGETTYSIGSGAYWNVKVGEDGSEENGNNDWTTAGIQYWLNSKGDEGQDIGYLNSLHQNAQNMIVTMKHYLGNVNYYNSNLHEIYNQERSANKVCNESCEGGDIFEGNQETWTGKIALAYPSDYVFTIDSQYWENNAEDFTEQIIKTSWLPYISLGSFISPYNYGTSDIIAWENDEMYDAWGLSAGSVRNYFSVHPTLYLNSDTMIIGGEGTLDEPYQLELN